MPRGNLSSAATIDTPAFRFLSSSRDRGGVCCFAFFSLPDYFFRFFISLLVIRFHLFCLSHALTDSLVSFYQRIASVCVAVADTQIFLVAISKPFPIPLILTASLSISHPHPTL